MKSYNDLVAETQDKIQELYPWDLEPLIADQQQRPLLIDIREPDEYQSAHIQGSINVPRGILESAAEWDYEDTVPALVQARQSPVVLLCRSGNRTVLAAWTLQQMGFEQVQSLKTGLRGWSDDDRPMVDGDGKPVDPDDAYAYFNAKPKPEQMRPS